MHFIHYNDININTRRIVIKKN